VETAIQSLFHPTRLGLKGYPDIVPHDSAPWVLVYSGATATGQQVVRLARLSGYRVVTTASSKNFDLLRSLGADAAFDYHDTDVADKIRQVTGDSLAYGVDAITEGDSVEKCVAAFGKTGGKLIILRTLPQDFKPLRTDVEIQCE
jgi:NADPH:quinone reductase-like Zn-dependent oxidoreductase